MQQCCDLLGNRISLYNVATVCEHQIFPYNELSRIFRLEKLFELKRRERPNKFFSWFQGLEIELK